MYAAAWEGASYMSRMSAYGSQQNAASSTQAVWMPLCACVSAAGLALVCSPGSKPALEDLKKHLGEAPGREAVCVMKLTAPRPAEGLTPVLQP